MSCTRRWFAAVAVSVLALVAVPFALAAADASLLGAPPPWELQERNDDPDSGFLVYKRSVPESDFEAFRLEAVVDAPPSVVAAAFRKNITDPTVSQVRTTKKVLRDDEQAIVVYSYIDMPLVSDRDVISRCERDADPQAGAYRYRWWASDEGPAPEAGVVRLEKSDGSWEFRPIRARGGQERGRERTFAIYEIHTEIGGSIPAWLVNRLMLDTVVDGIIDLRARVDRDLQNVAAGPPENVSKSR